MKYFKTKTKNTTNKLLYQWKLKVSVKTTAAVITWTMIMNSSLALLSVISSSFRQFCQSSGAVWKSRWPSWAPVPNKPTVSVDVKQHWTSFASRSAPPSVQVVVAVHRLGVRSSVYIIPIQLPAAKFTISPSVCAEVSRHPASQAVCHSENGPPVAWQAGAISDHSDQQRPPHLPVFSHDSPRIRWPATSLWRLWEWRNAALWRLSLRHRQYSVSVCLRQLWGGNWAVLGGKGVCGGWGGEVGVGVGAGF